MLKTAAKPAAMLLGAARRGFGLGRRSAPGAPPGQPMEVPDAEPTSVEVLAWGPEDPERVTVTTVEELEAAMAGHRVAWVNINGLRDITFVRAITEKLGVHPLAVEDMVHTHQRPKWEVYDDHECVVVRMPESNANGHLSTEQVFIVVGDGYVLTVQERAGDCLNPVRQRIMGKRPRMMAGAADYIAYTIIDAVVDHAFPVLDERAAKLESLEESVISPRPESSLPSRILGVRRDLLEMRRH